MSFGIANKAYVSTIQLLDKREINPNSLDIFNEEGLTDILGICGRYKPTTMASYHNYTNDSLFVQGVVAAKTAAAGTKADPLVLTLDLPTSGFARKTDAIKLPNGKVGYVINVVRAAGVGDVVTVEPINGAATLAVNVGDKLSFFTNAVGEKSLAVENRRYGLTKYVNLIQAFREVNEESDIQTMSAIEVKFDGQDRYHVKNLADKYIMHKASVNGALIGGSMSLKSDGATQAEFGTSGAEALLDPIGGGSTQFTRGLDEYTTMFGVDDSVAALGTIAISDFEDLIAQLLAKKAPKNYMSYASTLVRLKVTETFKGLNNVMAKGLLSLDGKSFDFDVDNVSLGGFKFQFANLPILDNIEFFGATDISKSVFHVPVDKVKVRGGGVEPRLQVRYMKHNLPGKTNEGNEIWGEWHTGALAPTGSTTDEMIWRTNWATYQGLEALGVQHFARTKVLA